MLLPVFRQSPLACPQGRSPGFDPTHPASLNCFISTIPIAAGVFNLITDAVGTAYGTNPAVALDGSIGMCAKTTGITQNGWRLSGNTTAQEVLVTMAAITRVTSLANDFQAWLSSGGNANTGVWLYVKTTGHLFFGFGGVANIDSGLILTANTPYFVAASYSAAATNVNFVLVNLSTGSMQTATGSTAGNSTVAPDNRFLIFGNTFASSNSPIGVTSNVMYNRSYLSMSALRMWANDPWSFWYPPRAQSAVGTLPAFLAAWARNRNVAVQGVAT